jgi:hypothetical protein
MMVRTLSTTLKAELVGYHRNFRIASANVRTDSGLAGVIGSPPRHEDEDSFCRGRGTYLPPVIEGHEGHPRSARAQWSGVIRAANLAFFYTCPLYLRVVPPVLTVAILVPDTGIRVPGPHRRNDPTSAGIPRGPPMSIKQVFTLIFFCFLDFDDYRWDALGRSGTPRRGGRAPGKAKADHRFPVRIRRVRGASAGGGRSPLPVPPPMRIV